MIRRQRRETTQTCLQSAGLALLITRLIDEDGYDQDEDAHDEDQDEEGHDDDEDD